ncbi:MAG: hypothetical protein HEP71_27700 [Roseivirga sp.]|nr:hypothetical protein [Roseivirga sp.]
MKENLESIIRELESRIEKDTKQLEADERVSERQAEDDKKEIRKIQGWVKVLIVIGVLVMLHGVVSLFLPEEHLLSLNEMGDYFGGTVASFWALAGVLYIYMSFLGQKTELGYTRLEQQRSRLQLLYNQKEMATQKYLIDEQVKGIKIEGARNEVNFHLEGIMEEIDRLTFTRDWEGINGLKMSLKKLIEVYIHKGKTIEDFFTAYSLHLICIDKTIKLIRMIKENHLPYDNLLGLVKNKLPLEVWVYVFYLIWLGPHKDLTKFAKETKLFDHMRGNHYLEQRDVERFLKDEVSFITADIS